ncbi:MAG: ABC transporter permease [Pseudomonadaceae bacterium]|nr:ABC transporter permease [Pseudomonadaceae bacterium]
MATANPIAAVGAVTLQAVGLVGSLSTFAGQAIRNMLIPRTYGQFIPQATFVGFDSLPIILLTAFFTGGVLALQSYNGFDNATLAGSQVPKVVALSMLRELGPVLGALMLASRAGSAMAAQLGTMRVTEQIDALYTLAVNPFRYLVVPRIWACVLMLPLLVVLANIVGIFGGYVVAKHVLHLPAHQYLTQTWSAIESDDITIGLVKALVFGFIIGLMSTYHGFNTRNGAEGVGRATTSAVVYAAVTILVADYLITSWFV